MNTEGRVIMEKRESFESDKEEAKYWHSMAYVEKQKRLFLETEVERYKYEAIGLKKELNKLKAPKKLTDEDWYL